MRNSLRLQEIACGVVAVLWATVGSGQRAEARPNLNGEGLGRLGRYEVLTFSDPAGNGIRTGKAIGVFDATPDEVFRTVTDYEHLAEFAPRLVSSKVVDQRGTDQAYVLIQTDLPWPVSKAWVFADFRVEKLPGAVYRVKFSQLQGSLRRYFGSILIEPWAQGKTSVTYEVLAEPQSHLAPRGILSNKLEDAAARYVHALRQHINDLHRMGRLHPVAPTRPLPSTIAGSTTPVSVENVANAR